MLKHYKEDLGEFDYDSGEFEIGHNDIFEGFNGEFLHYIGKGEKPVVIPEGVRDCRYMFAGCESFNQPVVIPEGVESCACMFLLCQSFNQPVKIPEGVKDCTRMFDSCITLNRHITIPNSVKNCDAMFMDCHAFNQPVTIPSSVKICSNMFYGCESLNQPVVIPAGAENCNYMLANCDSFNQPVIIPEGITDCNYMFAGCASFNQPVVIPDSVENCRNMFEDCTSFAQPVEVPESMAERVSMLEGAPLAQITVSERPKHAPALAQEAGEKTISNFTELWEYATDLNNSVKELQEEVRRKKPENDLRAFLAECRKLVCEYNIYDFDVEVSPQISVYFTKDTIDLHNRESESDFAFFSNFDNAIHVDRCGGKDYKEFLSQWAAVKKRVFRGFTEKFIARMKEEEKTAREELSQMDSYGLD